MGRAKRAIGLHLIQRIRNWCDTHGPFKLCNSLTLGLERILGDRPVQVIQLVWKDVDLFLKEHECYVRRNPTQQHLLEGYEVKAPDAVSETELGTAFNKLVPAQGLFPLSCISMHFGDYSLRKLLSVLESSELLSQMFATYHFARNPDGQPQPHRVEHFLVGRRVWVTAYASPHHHGKILEMLLACLYKSLFAKYLPSYYVPLHQVLGHVPVDLQVGIGRLGARRFAEMLDPKREAMVTQFDNHPKSKVWVRGIRQLPEADASEITAEVLYALGRDSACPQQPWERVISQPDVTYALEYGLPLLVVALLAFSVVWPRTMSMAHRKNFPTVREFLVRSRHSSGMWVSGYSKLFAYHGKEPALDSSDCCSCNIVSKFSSDVVKRFGVVRDKFDQSEENRLVYLLYSEVHTEFTNKLFSYISKPSFEILKREQATLDSKELVPMSSDEVITILKGHLSISHLILVSQLISKIQQALSSEDWARFKAGYRCGIPHQRKRAGHKSTRHASLDKFLEARSDIFRLEEETVHMPHDRGIRYDLHVALRSASECEASTAPIRAPHTQTSEPNPYMDPHNLKAAIAECVLQAKEKRICPTLLYALLPRLAVKALYSYGGALRVAANFGDIINTEREAKSYTTNVYLTLTEAGKKLARRERSSLHLGAS